MRKRLVDHGHTGSVQRVARRKFSAGADRDSHRGEIAVADNPQLLFSVIFRPAYFASFDVERSAPTVATERHRMNRRDRLNHRTAL